MIEVEGLPEGWKAVAYRVPKGNIEFVFIENVVREAKPQDKKCLIVEKIQPRRIVLEETNEERRICYGEWYESQEGKLMRWPYGGKTDGKHRVWREVKETDIPLINEDANVKMGVSQGDGGYYPTLELNVKELRNVRSLIKDFENLGWFINPEIALLLQKITEFIKDK